MKQDSSDFSGPSVDPALGEPLVDIEDLPAEPQRGRGWPGILLGASLVLIAFNLRPVFSSLSTLLPEVMETTGLSATGAALLTTLPVLCLGIFSFQAPGLARRFGAERVILACLTVLAVGTALRGLTAPWALFLGAVLAGSGIGIVNVLLPGLVKRDFPTHAAMMTGLYTMALCGGAAAAAALTVPIEKGLGGSWPGALAGWALPVVLVSAIWAPQALAARKAVGAGGFVVRGLARDRLAWQLTLFMGLQSSLAYIVFGWLAPMLRERGLDSVTAGIVVSVSVIAQMAACLAVPSIAIRRPDQRAINVWLLVFAAAAFLACAFAPLGGIWLWAIVLGLAQGGLLAAIMTQIILRSPDIHVAAKLSGMVQGVGYILAALGPLLVGALRGWTGDFHAAAGLFTVLAAGAAWNGWGAGRAGHVAVRAEPRQDR